MIGVSEKRVITYGTFDLFHYGHVHLLRRLSALGDRLFVGVSTDEFAAQKGKQAVMSFEERSEILQSCRYVDRVFPERHWDQKRTDIINYNIALFAMGDDWAGAFDDLGDLTQVIYLPRTQIVAANNVRQLDDQKATASKM